MKKYIILACPRSGTSYASRFLKIGHEKLDKDRRGIISWCLAATPEHRTLYGPSLPQVKRILGKEAKVYHQVRHPIKTISSFNSVSDRTLRYLVGTLKLNKNDSKMINHMKIWIKWNKRCEDLASDSNTYRIEDIEEYFPNISPYENKKENTRDHVNYSKEDLEKEDSLLFNEVVELAKKYGYDL